MFFRSRHLLLSTAASMNLSTVRPGLRMRVRQIESEPDTCVRLREMGFCENAEIAKLTDGSPLICRVCGVRVALSRKLAASILIELVPVRS